MGESTEIVKALVSPTNKLLDCINEACGKLYEPIHVDLSCNFTTALVASLARLPRLETYCFTLSSYTVSLYMILMASFFNSINLRISKSPLGLLVTVFIFASILPLLTSLSSILFGACSL